MTVIDRRLLLAAAGAAIAAPALAQTRPTLRIGLGPQQPTQADTRRVWEPVYKAVADKVGANLTLTVANDWAGIATALANEQIDVAQMGPWGYILAKVRGEARIINTMLVNGIPTYKAIIVARPGLTVAKFPDDAHMKKCAEKAVSTPQSRERRECVLDLALHRVLQRAHNDGNAGRERWANGQMGPRAGGGRIARAGVCPLRGLACTRRR